MGIGRLGALLEAAALACCEPVLPLLWWSCSALARARSCARTNSAKCWRAR